MCFCYQGYIIYIISTKKQLELYLTENNIDIPVQNTTWFVYILQFFVRRKLREFEFCFRLVILDLIFLIEYSSLPWLVSIRLSAFRILSNSMDGAGLFCCDGFLCYIVRLYVIYCSCIWVWCIAYAGSIGLTRFLILSTVVNFVGGVDLFLKTSHPLKLAVCCPRQFTRLGGTC